MKILLASVVFSSFVLAAGAQEYGRGALDSGRDTAGLGRAPLPAAAYDGFASGGSWGLKLGLGWASADWDLGPASGSKSLFAPQISLFYKTTDSLDVNFSTTFLSAKDRDDQLGNGQADMTRLALGIRYWVDTQARVTPYFGGGLGYYLLDGSTENTREDGEVVPVVSVSVKDAPGAFLEGGVAFLISDGFFIHTDLTYDFLLGSADAQINGKDKRFDVKSFSVNLGVTWTF